MVGGRQDVTDDVTVHLSAHTFRHMTSSESVAWASLSSKQAYSQRSEGPRTSPNKD